MKNTDTQETCETPSSGSSISALFSGLTTREARILKSALEWDPHKPLIRSEAEWLKYRGLGKKLLSKLRDREMVEGYKIRNSEIPLRIWDILNNAGIPDSKEGVRQALVTGKLTPGKLSNYGVKSDDFLRKWVGLPPRPTPVPSCIPRHLWKFDPRTGKPLPENR